MFQKQNKTDQKNIQKCFKNQSRRLPKSHFVPKAKFGTDCKPREMKKIKKWTPKSNQIVTKISPRGKLKATLLWSSVFYRFWSRFSSIFDPEIVRKPIWRQHLQSSCCWGKLSLPKLLIQMFCKNQNPLKRSEGRSKIDIAHVASYVNWPFKLDSFFEG